MELIVNLRSQAWTPVVLDSAVLETYWRCHDGYLPSYGWPPACAWFDACDRLVRPRPTMFKPAVGYFGKNRNAQQCVHFTNGRHRTRWLLEHKAQDVVMALAKEDVGAALKAGLVTRVLQQRGLFNLGFEMDVHAMLHQAEPGTTCFCGFEVMTDPYRRQDGNSLNDGLRQRSDAEGEASPSNAGPSRSCAPL